MTHEYVISLADPRATLAIAGGKGASLARLSAAGLPVPNGFHVTTFAYQQFVTANNLQSSILAALEAVDISRPATLETVSRTIYDLFVQATMPQDIADAITCAYTDLCNQKSEISNQQFPVAVRSSATAEDLPDLSFAGQQETFLNIHGVSDLLDAVKRCWASLWTARAIGYRAQHNIDQNAVSLAVVVQQLVFAEAAGILFTANPITGQRDQAMLTATWGLGEAIVGGLVTPDTLTMDKATGRMLSRETADKQVMTVRLASGTEEQPVPEEKRRAPVLDDPLAAELMRLGVQIEQLYQMPMDIEWTLAQNQFAIVQARPITALPQEAQRPERPLEWPLPHPKAMLARGSFAEFVPEPVSPLFATLAIPIAREASLALMRDFAGIQGNDSYLFSVINGYVYVGMVFTPKMMWKFLKATLGMSKKLMTTGRERAQAARDKCLAAVRKWQARAQGVAELAPSELLTGVREIFGATADYYTVAQSGTIPAASSSEITFTKFYDALVKRKDEPAAATFLFGAENQALRTEKSLFDLAAWVKGQPELAEQVAKKPTDEICHTLTAPANGTAWDEFRSRFAAHLAEFGHALYDLDFAKPVPADDPSPLIEAIKTYLAGGGRNPYERQRAALEHRERAAEAVTKRLDPLRRKWFLKLLKWAQDTAPLREDSIADLGLGHPQMRKMLGELGLRLAANGAIACAKDIYWLEAQEADELAAALENGQVLTSYADKVASRTATWQAMRRITPPGALPKKSWMSKLLPKEDQQGDTLKGMGASAGKVTARACVMLGPGDFSQMRPGDVIVAVTTTPAWTPLFARAAAIVTDIGGPLSHSSIVAREYGIPAVLGAGAATKRIHSGQMITVDGSAGIVTLMNGKSCGTVESWMAGSK